MGLGLRYLFSLVGLAGCYSVGALNLSRAGVQNVTFTVTNSNGIIAQAVRTVTITPACDDGERLCNDKVEHKLFGMSMFH